MNHCSTECLKLSLPQKITNFQNVISGTTRTVFYAQI